MCLHLYLLLCFFLLLCLTVLLAVGQLFYVGQHAREADIHALDDVGQIYILVAILGALLNIIAGGRIVGKVADPRKAIEAVSHRNINSLTEDTVSVLTVREHLGVAARDIENCGVLCLSNDSTHFYVADAVINSNQRDIVHH